MAVQRRAAGRHADHAHRRIRARQGQVRHHRICPDGRAHRTALPAAADDGSHPLAIQRRRADPPHREQPLASRGYPRDPSARRRGARHRDGDWVRVQSRAGETTLREDHRPRRARRRLHDLPSPRDRRQRHHHGKFRLGDQLPRIQGDGGAGVSSARTLADTMRSTSSPAPWRGKVFRPRRGSC